MPRRLILLIVVLSLPTLADDFWQKQPYQKWSKADTTKMLTDSPWTQHTTVSGDVSSGRDFSGTRSMATDAEHQSAPYVRYTAQLRSALPLRQAVVRQRQLDERYDSLAAD